LNWKAAATSNATIGTALVNSAFVADAAANDLVIRNDTSGKAIRFAITNTSSCVGLFDANGLNLKTGNLNLTSGGQIYNNASSNQLRLGNIVLNGSAGGTRTYTLPDGYQSCNLITNSIITGLTNASARPAVAANSTPQNYEIRALSTTSLASDDGFLRIRAGGSSSASSASWIDVSGASTVPDMNKNIVFGCGGSEVGRFDSTGLTTTGINLPVTSGTLSWTGAYTNTSSIRWELSGNKVTLTPMTSNGTATAASSSLDANLPASIVPNTTACGGLMIHFPFVITVNSNRRIATAIITAAGGISLYADGNQTLFTSGNVINWTAQSITYMIK
jgi:hypothetical protein